MTPIIAIGMPSPLELGIVLAIVVIFFGAGKLPQVFRELGKGMRALRDFGDENDIDLQNGEWKDL